MTGPVTYEACPRVAAKTVGLVARQSPDYVEKFFALLLDGAVVVPLRSSDDQYRIDATDVEDVVEPSDGSGWVDTQVEFPKSDALAQIAFTSGTEGNPKGVLLTSANLAATVERIRDVMEIDSSIREYIGIPVYHSFGFGRCRVVASVGGRAFIPAEGFNPREIADMLAADEINAISAVPSLWRIALQNADMFADCGHKVRWIEIGSQPMSSDEKARMRELFPNARIVQHYGLTEASRSTFLNISDAPEAQLDSVGTPNGDVEISIAENGRIRIRGSHVAASLLVDGTIIANTDSEGWLTTNDLGEMRDGALFFHGRADDVINSGGIKIPPDKLEEALKSRLACTNGIAVARVPDEARGDGVLVAALETLEHADSEILERAADALLEFGVNAGSSLHLMRMDELPVTDTGKVRRNALAEHFALTTLSRETTPGLARRLAGVFSRLKRQKPHNVKALYAQEFPTATVTGRDSFVGLGGDSLSFVSVSITLEDMLGQLPDNWQNMTADELDAVRPRTRVLHPVDTSLFVRFISITAIVTGHLSLVPVGGATFLLLTVAGFNFARFHLPGIVERNAVAPILSTTSRLALPLLLMLSMLQIRQQDLRPFEFTLLTNWTPAEGQLLDFWFIEFMVQLFLIVAALFCVPTIRKMARTRPQTLAWLALAVTTALAMVMPLIWDTAPLYDRVPPMLMWLFALGWVIQLATTPLLKATVAAIAIVLPFLVWGPRPEVDFWIANGHLWVALGCLVVLFVERIPLPWPLNKLAFWVGGASMMIYIVHWQVYFNWLRLGLVENAFIDIVVAITGGVICWWGWEKLTRFVAERFARRRRAAIGTAAARPAPRG